MAVRYPVFHGYHSHWAKKRQDRQVSVHDGEVVTWNQNREPGLQPVCASAEDPRSCHYDFIGGGAMDLLQKREPIFEAVWSDR